MKTENAKPKKLGYRFLRTFFSMLIRILWPMKIIGRENMIYGSRVLYVANHYSALDIVPIAARLFKKDFNAVIKEEAYNHAKGFFNVIGTIPVKRGEADLRAVKGIMQVLNADRPLFIFPEGRRNPIKDSTELLPFQSGAVTFAMRTKSPIVPILIYRGTRIFRKNYLIIGKSISYEKYFRNRDRGLPDALTLELEETLRKMRKEFEVGLRKK